MGNFLKKFPNQKPAIDIKNDIKPINKTDNKSGVFVKFKLTPEASASMLVAMPRLIKHFKSRHSRSLIVLATGTGKTITSLNCLLEIYKHSGYYKALILVPTITLVEQWEKECRKFHFNKIIKVSSKNNNWKDNYSNFVNLLQSEKII